MNYLVNQVRNVPLAVASLSFLIHNIGTERKECLPLHANQ